MEQSLQTMKALSDMNRLRVVSALRNYDELCACQITELLQVTGATASRHLSVLHRAGLVDSRKEGRWIYYRLTVSAENEALFDWLEIALAGSEKLKEDEQALETIVETTREDLCRKQRGERCCP